MTPLPVDGVSVVDHGFYVDTAKRDGMRGIIGAVAVVTGASSGIGRATAHALALAGAHVVLVARRSERLEQVAAEIAAFETDARTVVVVADVTAGDTPKRVSEAAASLGAWSLLINNAGMDGQGASAEHLDTDTMCDLLAANVVAPLQLAQALVAGGTARAIVNVSSINGRSAEEHFADYNASKAALISLTQSLAMDFAPLGVRVNAVCPGYTETEMTAPYLADAQTRARIEGAIPLGRVGTAAEIAETIMFLLSDHATYVTGEALVVDGGRLAGWRGSA